LYRHLEALSERGLSHRVDSASPRAPV
jgi:hypothetical protein